MRDGERTLSDICVDSRGDFFPIPIDLGDIEVGIWSIGDENRPRAERYRRFLKNDPRFRRSTYRTVELSLRNRGHESDADAIYVAMKHRAEDERRSDAPDIYKATLRSMVNWLGQFAIKFDGAVFLISISALCLIGPYFFTSPLSIFIIILLVAALSAFLLKRPRYYAHKFLLGFGTAPLRTLYIILALWAMMLPAYMNVENFQPSEAALAVTITPPDAKEMPDPAEVWRMPTPLFVSLNYHVPMLSISARDDWELRDSGPLKWKIFGWDYSLDFMCPEDWGILMIVINWILWPLVLTFLIKKAVRNAGQ